MTVSPAIRIGTSGLSYKEWLGSFYPQRLPGNKMLAYYAARFPTVEINYTFRAMPRPAMLAGWGAQTPEDFRFALKASQRITHLARLRNVEADLDRFVEATAVLGDKLGPVLFQLPPGFKRDVPLIKEFLLLLNERIRAAFEFRDKTWFEDSVFEALRGSRAALCIAESDKLSTPIERTAPYVYVRLRNQFYDDESLGSWAERLRRFAADGAEVYAYLKHDVAAPHLAMRLRELLSEVLNIA